MRPDKLSIPQLFEGRNQYLIPLFQRGYVWTLNDQICPLWEDIMDRAQAIIEYRADAEKVGSKKLRTMRKHFLGTVVVGVARGGTSDSVPTREVIDGQQRITTLQILILALRDVCAEFNDEALTDDLKLLTRNRGNYRDPGHQLKVWPTNVGRDVMKTLFESGDVSAIYERFPAHGDLKRDRLDRPLMVQAYLFFHAMLMAWFRGIAFDDPEKENSESTVTHAVIRSIEKDNDIFIPGNGIAMKSERAHLLLETLRDGFQIMSLELEEEDDPQIIFETLNARGAPLQPSDLIRNFLFLQATRKGEPVDDLYKNYWQAFDDRPDGDGRKGAKFWRQEERQGRLKNTRMDLLLYHYVGLRKCEELKVAHVFDEFKDWWESTERETAVELKRIMLLAKHYETFLVPDQKTRFGLFCRRMKLLDTSTLTPLIFYFLEHHKPNALPFISILDQIESYLVRRFVCGLTTKGYNRVFLRILSELTKDKLSDPDSLRKHLLALQGDSQRWPNDEEFAKAWRTRPLYQGKNTSKVLAILEALELGQRSNKNEDISLPDGLTVEHVLPQKWTEDKWPGGEALRDDLVMRDYFLHSIGNLTLVTGSFNSSLSNESFSVKRPEIAKISLLTLNTYFQDYKNTDTWDEDEMMKRADTLFPLAKKIWPL